MATMSIGPAAENSVVFSSIFVDDGRAFGRAAEALFCIKKVKALAVRGDGAIPLADKAKCKQIADHAGRI